ncbi:MAG: hypothetical protein K6G50_06075 [bacterium]|nr:hypothetical protein [bacterium]
MHDSQLTNTNTEKSSETITSLGEAIYNISQNTSHPHLGNIKTNSSNASIDPNAPEVKLPSYYDELAKKYNLMTHEEVNTLMALTHKLEKTKIVTDRIYIVAYILMILSGVGIIIAMCLIIHRMLKNKITITSTGRRTSMPKRPF